MAHVARNRQTEATADHVAQKIEQNEVKTPVVETEFFQGLEAVDDAASAAAATHFGATQLHGEHAIALEADVADADRLAGQLEARGGFDDGGAGFAAEQETGGVALGVATDQQHFFALLGHHVTEVGQREAFADAALAVNGNDLGLFGHWARVHRRGLFSRLAAQQLHEFDGLAVITCGGCHALALHWKDGTGNSFIVLVDINLCQPIFTVISLH